MAFRRETSFNSADSTLRTRHGRIVVVNGVQARCKKVMASIKKLTKERTLAYVYEIVNDIQRTNKSYSYTDIIYALRKCVEMGQIESPGWGAYQLRKKAV